MEKTQAMKIAKAKMSPLKTPVIATVVVPKVWTGWRPKHSGEVNAMWPLRMADLLRIKRSTKIGKRIWIPPHPPLTCKIPNVTLIELHQFGLFFYCKQRLEKRPETLNLTNEVSHMKLKRHALKKRMKAKHFAWNIRFTSSDSFFKKTILSKQIKVFWFARKLSNNFQTVSTLLS